MKKDRIKPRTNKKQTTKIKKIMKMLTNFKQKTMIPQIKKNNPKILLTDKCKKNQKKRGKCKNRDYSLQNLQKKDKEKEQIGREDNYKIKEKGKRKKKKKKMKEKEKDRDKKKCREKGQR